MWRVLARISSCEGERADELMKALKTIWTTDATLGRDRTDFTGTLEQIADDVVATRNLGATELLFDVQFSPGVEAADDILTRMEQLWELSKVS